MKAGFKRAIWALGCLFVNNAWALELPSVFGDKMILQRELVVPVWGTAQAGSLVTVGFGGQVKKATADQGGIWRVDLEPLKASAEARVMTITGDEQIINYTDVLVGEVWFAGGQSNMYRPFRMLTGPATEPLYEPVAEYLRTERDTAHDPLLRQYRAGQIYKPYSEEVVGRGNWSKAVSGEVNEFCATAYFFGRELRRELDVPVALISCNKGATSIETWILPRAFEGSKPLSSLYSERMRVLKQEVAAWDEEVEMAKYRKLLEKRKQAIAAGEKVPKRGPKKPQSPLRGNQVPGALCNGMVLPIAPYAMRGVIWYQGESNSGTQRGNIPADYGDKLVALVAGWRSVWGQERLPFYWCQLANYKSVIEEPQGDEVDGFTWVQWGQREALDKISDSGMAVLNDIGEGRDVHPKNKVDAGKRLSLWALNKVYRKGLVFSGPLYRSAKIKGSQVELQFDQVGSGLMVGHKHLLDATVEIDEPLKGFQICGLDRKWRWAQAEITGKDTIAVWNDEIIKPFEVRYAWATNPKGANCYNKEGLPASLFKTGAL